MGEPEFFQSHAHCGCPGTGGHFKNNKPKYLLVDIESTPYFDMTDDEKIDVIAARILKKFKPAFEELAK